MSLPFAAFNRLLSMSFACGGCVIDDTYLIAKATIFLSPSELIGAHANIEGCGPHFCEWLRQQKKVKLIRVWEGCTGRPVVIADWMQREPMWVGDEPTYDITALRNESNHLEESLGTRFEHPALESFYADILEAMRKRDLPLDEWGASMTTRHSAESRMFYNLIRGIEKGLFDKKQVNSILVDIPKTHIAALKEACGVKSITASKLIDLVRQV